MLYIDGSTIVVKQAHLRPQYQSTQSHCIFETQIMPLLLNFKVMIVTAA
jgi:hypothetical protein